MAKLLIVDLHRCRIHPQELLKQMGIIYQYAVPQSITDSWEFWNPENLPDKLPPMMNLTEANPDKWLNRGLSIDMIYEIKKEAERKKQVELQMKHIFEEHTSKLPQWLREDLQKLAIGGVVVLLIIFIVWIVMLFKRYVAMIAIAIAIIGISYIIGELVMFVKRLKR
jgi:hypothetical protein